MQNRKKYEYHVWDTEYLVSVPLKYT